MGGEIGLKINKVSCSNDLIKPFNDYTTTPAIDLTIQTDDGWFHLCGDNDWGYLALEAIKPVLKAGIELKQKINENILKYQPEVILLGKNEFRILDILHIARDSELGIEMIQGIPVVKGKFTNGIKFLGKNDEIELPLSNDKLPF